MTQPVTADVVRTDAARHLGVAADRLTGQVRLAEDLGLDSLAGLELSMSLEDKYKIAITDDELSEVTTYGELEAMVLAKVSSR